MAPGLKHWVGAVLLGMAGVAVWAFPMPVDEPDASRDLGPRSDRFLELQSQVLLEREHVRRLDWLDSLTALVHATGDAPAVVFGAPGNAPSQPLEYFRQRLREEVAALGGQPVDIGVFNIGLPRERPPVEPVWRYAHSEYFVGTDAGRPYCFVAIFGENQVLRDRWPAGSGVDMLGSCAFVLRYGLPGPQVARWLKDGSFARGRRRALSDLVNAGFADVERLWGLAGMQRSTTLEGQSCLGGNVESCTNIFLQPIPMLPISESLADRIPELWALTALAQFESRWDHLGWIESMMFTELEREFGQERFGHFWSSHAEVTVAFEEAFGVPAGVWLQRWARSYYRPDGFSLRAGFTNWASTIVALLGAVAVVVGTVRRRRVA